MEKVKLIINDIETEENIENIAYDDEETNISIFHTEKSGFILSILDRKSKIMTYYKVKKGELVETEKENIITGKSVKRKEVVEKLSRIVTSMFMEISEEDIYKDNKIDKDIINVADLSDEIETKFDIEKIDFSEAMGWESFMEIVRSIEMELL